MQHRDEGAQVRVAVFESEPLARLAEQRLQEEGIPCVVQPLGVGPGGWGMAANLPHALYVLAEDEGRARQVLELLPAELLEREGMAPPARPWSRVVLLVLLITAAALVLSLVDALFTRLLR